MWTWRNSFACGHFDWRIKHDFKKEIEYLCKNGFFSCAIIIIEAHMYKIHLFAVVVSFSLVFLFVHFVSRWDYKRLTILCDFVRMERTQRHCLRSSILSCIQKECTFFYRRLVQYRSQILSLQNIKIWYSIALIWWLFHWIQTIAMGA